MEKSAEATDNIALADQSRVMADALDVNSMDTSQGAGAGFEWWRRKTFGDTEYDHERVAIEARPLFA
jgi:hypothetical protein